MKPRLLLLAFGLLGICGVLRAAQSQPTASTQTAASVNEATLALQVAEVASSTKIPDSIKQKRIADLVRRSILHATAKVQDPEQAVAIAVQFATAASRAAPEYTQLIINAVVSIPSISSISGAMAAVSDAIVGAASSEAQGNGSDQGSVTNDGGRHYDPSLPVPTTPYAYPQYGSIAR